MAAWGQIFTLPPCPAHGPKPYSAPPVHAYSLDITLGISLFCIFLSLMWLPRWNKLGLPLILKENNSHKFNDQPSTRLTAVWETSNSSALAICSPAQEQNRATAPQYSTLCCWHSHPHQDSLNSLTMLEIILFVEVPYKNLGLHISRLTISCLPWGPVEK